jgi:hypothetical protein
MKRTFSAVFSWCWGGILHAQTPTITSVTNESGESFLCPGGIAFVRGTGLGTSTKSPLPSAASRPMC